MKLKLEHEKLTNILMDFYTLSHIRIVIYDSSFQRIAAYPEKSSDFCSLLKQNSESKMLCRKSEAESCIICSKKNSLHVYQCHAGLTEAVAPIKMNDIILGYIMFGQILSVNSDTESILEYASKYIDDQTLLQNSFSKLKVRDDRQIQAIANIMQACTSYLWVNELIKMDSENSVYILTDYINEHLCEDLSVDNLCSLLNISRVKLYEIAHKYYGMSIAKYILKKRIEKAAQLLSESDCYVRDAAINVGFYDYNYFSKVFKKEMGITPLKYKMASLGGKKSSRSC